MARVNDLLRRVRKIDPALASDLEAEIRALSSRREFGLNFERHIPEMVDLPGRIIRRGDKVRFLQPRTESGQSVDDRLWRVTEVFEADGNRIARLTELGSNQEPETAERAIDDLIAVAEFRDPIFPGLRSTGKVERGGDKPYHTVINGENYHALEALLFAYEAHFRTVLTRGQHIVTLRH